MEKISIFVEGQTERIFVEKLLEQYLTVDKFVQESYKLNGDRVREIKVRRSNLDNALLYILIFDVGGDGGVTSAILERGQVMLEKDGYKFLLGLRDLHPIPISNKDQTFKRTDERIQSLGLDQKIKIVYAVMEIEAWFLADHLVFPIINAQLAPEFIKQRLNIDLIKDDPEAYSKPACLLENIYDLVGLKYRKRESDSYRIVCRLNFPSLILDTSKIASFHYFIKQLNKAISCASL